MIFKKEFAIIDLSPVLHHYDHNDIIRKNLGQYFQRLHGF